jgi:hypothetical protein
MQEEMISIQIPQGAEVGDELSFYVEGQELSIPVPWRSKPGDVLQIKLGGKTRESDGHMDMHMEDETDESVIPLMTGNHLRLAFPSGNDATSAHNHQPQLGCCSTSADGTFQWLWPASKFVINYMNTSTEFHRMIQDGAPIRSMLELGAGTGMFGLAFADIVSWLSKSHQQTIRQMVLTDMEEAIGPLKANVEINHSIFKGRVQISTLPLTWHSAPVPTTNCTIDYILGSDLLYNCENIPHLVSTLRRLLCKTTNVLLAVRWRKPARERAFFLALSDILTWTMIHGMSPLDFRSYGHPASDESNKYFRQTMVGCNGKAIPLSMIDETATSQMTESEFEEYEALQTQVYLGRVTNVDPDHHPARTPKRPKKV